MAFVLRIIEKSNYIVVSWWRIHFFVSVLKIINSSWLSKRYFCWKIFSNVLSKKLYVIINILFIWIESLRFRYSYLWTFTSCLNIIIIITQDVAESFHNMYLLICLKYWDVLFTLCLESFFFYIDWFLGEHYLDFSIEFY